MLSDKVAQRAYLALMKLRLEEAPIINAFHLEPVEEPVEREDLDEKVLYKGWLPVDDEYEVPTDDPRAMLESFIRHTVDDEDTKTVHADEPDEVVGMASGEAGSGRHGGGRVGLGAPGLVRQKYG